METKHQKDPKQNHERQEEEEKTVKRTGDKYSGNSPPSASSSPSHEFTFTVSLHSSSTPLSVKPNSTASFAVDLSPADDIFFHGHLLPLHLLSNLPVSPRTSTNSLDSFSLPVRELYDDRTAVKNHSCSNNNMKCNDCNISSTQKSDAKCRARNKQKTFSLFRWRKGCEVDKEYHQKQKKKVRFEVSNVVKRYVRMMRPLLFFKGRREDLQFKRQPYSFPGNLSFRNEKEVMRGRRGQHSAPASIRTSPTNSGVLVATSMTTSFASSTSDSTMEELQAAIQAAIAHCKNSIAAEEKIKC